MSWGLSGEHFAPSDVAPFLTPFENPSMKVSLFHTWVLSWAIQPTVSWTTGHGLTDPASAIRIYMCGTFEARTSQPVDNNGWVCFVSPWCAHKVPDGNPQAIRVTEGTFNQAFFLSEGRRVVARLAFRIAYQSLSAVEPCYGLLQAQEIIDVRNVEVRV